MPNKIIWSPLANHDFEIILDHLSENWNNQIAIIFLENLDSFIETILENPQIFPFANKKLGVRKSVISKQNTLYYKENNGDIEILRIFDTRQNPEKIKYIITP